MKNILYAVAVLLIIVWIISKFIYAVAGTLINVLLVIAVIAIVVNIYKHRRSR